MGSNRTESIIRAWMHCRALLKTEQTRYYYNKSSWISTKKLATMTSPCFSPGYRTLKAITPHCGAVGAMYRSTTKASHKLISSMNSSLCLLDIARETDSSVGLEILYAPKHAFLCKWRGKKPQGKEYSSSSLSSSIPAEPLQWNEYGLGGGKYLERDRKNFENYHGMRNRLQ